MNAPGEPSGRSSFWTSLPGVLTGSAAVITAVVGALALLRGGGGPGPDSSPPAAVSERAEAAERPADGTSAPVVTDAGGVAVEVADPPCLQSYLAGVAAERRKALNLGAAEQILIGATEPKSGVFAVRLSDAERPIGVLRFTVRTSDQTFHIAELVDANCRAVHDLANASRGGDPQVLLNWDEVRFRTGGESYLIRFGYSAGEVSIGYFRRIVE